MGEALAEVQEEALDRMALNLQSELDDAKTDGRLD